MEPRVLIVGGSEMAHKLRSDCKHFITNDNIQEIPSLAQKRTRDYSVASLTINGVEMIAEGPAMFTFGSKEESDTFAKCELMPTITGRIIANSSLKKINRLFFGWQPPIKKRNKRLTKKLGHRVCPTKK